MIVEVTMSNIVVDSSAVNHGSKHISTGADPIPNATESAGGIVKLGATGVPDAAKVPKALGADLVALITAAGYSLSPAEGTATLDGIADGTTYKRVLAAPATALNGGTYDAPKCTAFGIGTLVPVYAGSGAAIDSTVLGGRYYCANPVGISANTYALEVIPISSGFCRQKITGYDTGLTYERVVAITAGPTYTPGPWYQHHNAQTDGNLGQTPMPKPTEGTPAGGADGPGQCYKTDFVQGSGNNLYPAGDNKSKSGTWRYDIHVRIRSTGLITNRLCGIASGTVSLGMAPNTHDYSVMAERVL